MEYEVLRSYSGDDLSDYYRAYRFKRRRKPAPKEASPVQQSVASAIFLLIGFAGIWLSTGRDGTVYGALMRWVSAFFLGGGMLLLLRNLGAIGPGAAKAKREQWAEENSKGYCRFSDTGFASYIGDAAYAYNYAAVEALLEDAGHYYLFISQNAGHILCKSAFTRGDPESFRAFLEERTGQKFLYVTTR